MLSVFDRIRDALAQGIALSKSELFLKANLPKTESSRALFQVLVENGKLIPIGKGRMRKYCLPLVLDLYKLPQKGMYKFSQKGDGKITFIFEQEEPIVFQSYDDCADFIKRRLIDGRI